MWRAQADGDSEGPRYTPYRDREPWEGDTLPDWPEEDAGPEYHAYRALADRDEAIEAVIEASKE